MNQIPQIIVLNKADRARPDEIEDLARQISLDKDAPIVAISAIRRETLRPLVEQIAARIGTFSVDRTAAAGNR
jgi:50S ribosomal subunit-associated GTPase HflX